MRYLVTGAAGFVGGHLSRRLVQEGHMVVGVGRRASAAGVDDLVASGRFVLQAADIGDIDELGRVVGAARPLDGIFHVAARLPTADGALAPLVRTNTLGTANVLQVAREAGVRRIVVSSSMSVYAAGALPPIAEDAATEPETPYGLSKLHAEAVTRVAAAQWGLHTVCLRYCGIFGRGNPYGSLHLYASRALANRPIEVFAQGKIVKEFVAVADVVDANLLAMGHAERFIFDVFNIGGGEAPALADLAALVVRTAGAGDVRLTDAPAAPGVRDFAYDIARARRLLNYAPAPLADRVRQYVDDLRDGTAA